MEKDEILNRLSKMAREITERYEMLITWGAKSLADNLAVWHIVNFEIQRIVRETPIDKISSALSVFRQSLWENMVYFRDNGVSEYSCIYASALDGFNRSFELVRAYI